MTDKVKIKTPHGEIDATILKPGMQVDLHVCLTTRTFPDDFESKCSRCSCTLYHHDLSVAKALICMNCLILQLALEKN